MYEEFGHDTSNTRRSVEHSYLDSVRDSFTDLLLRLQPPVQGYEPLIDETGRSNSQGIFLKREIVDIDDDENTIAFSNDASSVSTFPNRQRRQLKSFDINSSTIGACVLNLLSTIIGSGVLGLPYAFSKTGWVLGVFILVSTGILSAFSLHLTCICAARDPPFSIQAVLKGTHISFSAVVEFSQLVCCFGACVSYLVVVGGMMSTLVDGFGVNNSIWTHREIWIVIAFVIVVPPCFISKLDTLKYTSGLSLLFISFVASILFFFSLGMDSFQPCASYDDDSEKCNGGTHAASISLDTLRVLSIFVFAFTGTQVCFVYCEL